MLLLSATTSIYFLKFGSVEALICWGYTDQPNFEISSTRTFLVRARDNREDSTCTSDAPETGKLTCFLENFWDLITFPEHDTLICAIKKKLQ